MEDTEEAFLEGKTLAWLLHDVEFDGLSERAGCVWRCLVVFGSVGMKT